MSNKIDKPKLTSEQLVIDKMQADQGITFKYHDIYEAADYLAETNNYLRLASCRHLYPKYQLGPNKGKYINLDFAYLKELSELDMRYRFLVKLMCSDIEHFLGVQLLRAIENDSTTDGYDIVKDFIDNNQYVLKVIATSINSPHIGDLIKKYFTVSTSVKKGSKKTISTITAYDDCPAWAFIECITFGVLISFYQYYCKTRALKPICSEELFNIVRTLRNGVSHDACLLCNLSPGTTIPSKELSTVVASLGTVTTSQRRKRLSSRCLLELTALLYMYSKIVGTKVMARRSKDLYELFEVRMIEKKGFFTNNQLLIQSYEYAMKMIYSFLPR